MDRDSGFTLAGFKNDFSNVYRVLNQGKNPKFRLWDKTFFTMCDKARSSRTPVLIIVLADQQAESMHRAC
jgi:hypothetical protein